MTRFRSLATLVVAFTLAFALPGGAAPLTYPVPIVDGFPTGPPPSVTAATWIIYDDSAETELASQLPDEERSIASVTKIMTALLAIEMRPMNEMVTVSRNAAETGEREIELFAGEQLELGALVKAAMIHSANDAATAIAEHVGGSVEGFVAIMNARADELNLTGTSFANPHGLDQENHYSTARDMLNLTLEAMKHQEFRDLARSRKLTFPDAPDGSKRLGTSTNLMLGDYEGANGVKTGFTNDALLTFVASAERDGRELYVVVLGSDGRRAHFSDAESLLDWGFGELRIYGTLAASTPYTSLQPKIGAGTLRIEAGLEALVHLSAQGLQSNPPSTTVEDEPAADPVEPSVRTTKRNPTEAPKGILGTLAYWWNELVGS